MLFSIKNKYITQRMNHNKTENARAFDLYLLLYISEFCYTSRRLYEYTIQIQKSTNTAKKNFTYLDSFDIIIAVLALYFIFYTHKHISSSHRQAPHNKNPWTMCRHMWERADCCIFFSILRNLLISLYFVILLHWTWKPLKDILFCMCVCMVWHHVCRVE